MSNAKPCPFCGQLPRVYVARNGECRIECCNWLGCDINPRTKWNKNEDEAVKCWNHRARRTHK